MLEAMLLVQVFLLVKYLPLTELALGRPRLIELPPLVEPPRQVELRGVVLDKDSVPLLAVLALLVMV